MKRRDFLTGRRQAVQSTAPGIGIQLYTVRDAMDGDVERTLEALAEMGYELVELAGLYGLDPRQMRRRLDDVGLRAASSHHDLNDIRGDWERVLEGALELGQAHVVIPWLPNDVRNPEGLAQVADDFNRAGEAAAAVGLRFGYHNHAWEVVPMADGRRPIDVLLSWTEPDYVDWQMDMYWVADGYDDARAPFWHLERQGDRVTTLHLKDRTGPGEMVDVGAGVIDYARLLGLARRHSAVTHAFVEHDEPVDSLATARASLEHVVDVMVEEVAR